MESGMYRKSDFEDMEVVNVSLNSNHKDINVSLIDAIQRLDVAKVQQFINGGANVNCNIFHCIYNTPLQQAISVYNISPSSCEQIISILLSAGADPNYQDMNGNNILHFAISRDNMGLAALAIDSGVDMDAFNNENQTAMDIALMSENCPHLLLEFLMKRGANPNVDNLDTGTLLHKAANMRSPQYIDTILDLLTVFGCNINARCSDNGNTPLHNAVLHKNYLMMETLLNIPLIDIHIKNYAGETALITSIYSDDFNALALLIKHGANVDEVFPQIREFSGFTPLHLAARMGKVNVFQLMMYASPDVTIKTYFGNTLLHLSVLGRSPDIVKLALFLGGNDDIPDNRGLTALDLALKLELYDIALLLVYQTRQRNESEISKATLQRENSDNSYHENVN